VCLDLERATSSTSALAIPGNQCHAPGYVGLVERGPS
jgi:hypothetical protein